MKIRLLTFASASDAVGSNEVTIELAGEHLDVRSLKAELETRYPSLGGLWTKLAVAVDGQIAVDSDPVADGCEVALLPPVSGGSQAAARNRTNRKPSR